MMSGLGLYKVEHKAASGWSVVPTQQSVARVRVKERSRDRCENKCALEMRVVECVGCKREMTQPFLHVVDDLIEQWLEELDKGCLLVACSRLGSLGLRGRRHRCWSCEVLI